MIQCNCADTTGYRTLAQLRTAIMSRLGFSDPMANIATRSLLDLRNDLLIRMGNAALVGAALPPGEANLLNSFINEAQQILFRRLELDKGTAALPARMVADADLTTLDYVPVLNLATALGKAHYGKTDAKAYFEITEKYVGDTAMRRPPNAVALLTEFLQDAQRQVVRRYPAVRMDRWFSWTLTAANRFYDLTLNDEATLDIDPVTPGVQVLCAKTIDPLSIKEVMVARGNTRIPLRKGIPSTALGYTTSGYPSHYDIKQCIEVWPAPSTTAGTLLIRSGFNATAFVADTDQPSVDDELVLLLALANAKAHYKQPDAANVVNEFEVHLMGVVAGSHGADRYVPGNHREANLIYVEPMPSVPFA